MRTSKLEDEVLTIWFNCLHAGGPGLGTRDARVQRNQADGNIPLQETLDTLGTILVRPTET